MASTPVQCNVSDPNCQSKLLRVGAVSYLNSKPLIYGLEERLDGNGQLSVDLPSRLADQLSRNEIDIGLIPVVEYLRNPHFKLISNSAIVSRGPVWSVRLFFRRRPADVRTVALDEGSRTSAALTRVLLFEELGRMPETCVLPIDADVTQVQSDAVLVIGDRAMHPESYRKEFPLDWDLGEIWYRQTGLPFVFATWVARSDAADLITVGSLLDQTRTDGTRNVNQIARDCADRYQLTEEACIDYLTNYIHFEFDAPAHAGLELFRKRCQDLQIVPRS